MAGILGTSTVAQVGFIVRDLEASKKKFAEFLGCPVPPTLFKFFFWIGYCNSSLNPVIYTWRSRDLRREVLRPLQCWGQAAGMQGRRDRTPGHHLLPLRSSSSLEKGMHVPTSPTFLEGNTIV